MTYREVGGSIVFQGTVSGTDQTPVSLHDPSHALRVYLENPQPPTIENIIQVFTGDGGMIINTTASGAVTITGAGNVDVITEGSVLTISGTGAADHGQLSGLLDDDHPQYLLVDGTRPMAGNLDLDGNDVTNVDTLTAVTGTFTSGLTIGSSTIHLNPNEISAPSGTYTLSLTISGVPVATSLDVEELQSQIEAFDPDEVEPAIIGSDGITVVSGANTTNIVGFYSEFTAASGSLQNQIDTLDTVYATDAELVSVSGHLQSQITDVVQDVANLDLTYATDADLVSVSGHLQAQLDGIDFPEFVETALIGSDGITIISGSNLTTVQGFYGEFVAASGTLQQQFDDLNLNYATDAELTSVSGHLQAQLDNIDFPEFTETALLGADGITIISGSNSTTVQGFYGEFVSTSGNLQTQINELDLQQAYEAGRIVLTLAGAPVEIKTASGTGTAALISPTLTVSGAQPRVVFRRTTGAGTGELVWIDTTHKWYLSGNDSAFYLWAETAPPSPLTEVLLNTGPFTDFFISSDKGFRGNHIISSPTQPTFSFSDGFNILGDTDTGMYWIAENVMGFTAGGTGRVAISGTGSANDGMGVAGKVSATQGHFATSLTVSGVPVSIGSGGVTDHGALSGLTDDDHPQYFNTTRGDARYIHRALVGQDKVTVVTGTNTITISGAPTLASELAHGELLGLDDDDHPQYFNTTRGDARYLHKALLGGNNITVTSGSNAVTVDAADSLQLAYEGGRLITLTGTTSPVEITNSSLDLPALIVRNKLLVSGSPNFGVGGGVIIDGPSAALIPAALVWQLDNVDSWLMGLFPGGIVGFADPALTNIPWYVDPGDYRFSAGEGFSAPFGTEAAPTYSFGSILLTEYDFDTGMYRIDEDVLGFSAGGVLRVSVSGAGNAQDGLGVAGNLTATSGTLIEGLTVGNSTSYIYPNEVRSPRGTFDNLTVSGIPVPLEAGGLTNPLTEDVNAAGFNLSNVGQITASSGTFNNSANLTNNFKILSGFNMQTETSISLGNQGVSNWKIARNEDGDFSIRDEDNGDTAVFTIENNAPAATLRITSDGRVGIGTFSPDRDLHVDGAALVENDLITRNRIVASGVQVGSEGDQTWLLVSGTKTPTYGIFTSRTLDLNYAGPGDPIPQAFSFAVQNTSGNRDVTFDINSGEVGDPQPGEIRFLDRGALIWRLGKSTSNGFELRHPSHSTFPKITIASGVPDRFLTITESGFLGINQSTPTERLHVVGSGTFAGLVTSDPGSGNANAGIVSRARGTGVPFFRLASNGQSTQWRTDISSNNYRVVDEVSSTAPLVVESGTPNNLLVLDNQSNGRVGIRTDAPATDFHVVGSGRVDGNFAARSAIAGNASIQAGAPAIGNLYYALNYASIPARIAWIFSGLEVASFGIDAFGSYTIGGLFGSTVPFALSAGAPTNSMVINTDGTVGLGGVAQSGTLHVYGGGYFNNGVTVSGVPVALSRGYGLTNSSTQVFNSNTETDILNYTIPASELGSATNPRVLQFSAAGEYHNSSGSNRTLRLRIYLGGVQIYDDTTGNIATSATASRAWRLTGELIPVSSPSGYTYLGGQFNVGGADANTSNLGVGGLGATDLASYPIVASGTPTLTNAVNFRVTLTNSINLTTVGFKRHFSTARVI